MTQKEVFERLQRDCETMQIHGGECFASKLIDLATSFYREKDIKTRCFAYLNATGQLKEFYGASEETKAQSNLE